MKRYTTSSAILCLLICGASAFCQIELPAPENPPASSLLSGITGFVLHPWVTALLIFAGMMLVISEVLSIGSWGATGTAGILCVASVVGASVLAGVAAWTGVALLLAGVGLLLIESRVLPGRGISAIAGLACLFLGMYWTLGGASAGMLYAAAMATLFTLMSAIVFLVHLPHNSAWHAVGRKLEMHVGHPYGAMGTGRVEIETVSPEPPEVLEEQPGRRPVRTDSESDDDQQTVQGNG